MAKRTTAGGRGHWNPANALTTQKPTTTSPCGINLRQAARGSEGERIKMQKLANAIVLTSQGIPFLHGGQDFARTKYGEDNSYQSPDRINRMDWPRKVRYREIFDYTQGLISLRRAHPAFRLSPHQRFKPSLPSCPCLSRIWLGISWAPMQGETLGA